MRNNRQGSGSDTSGSPCGECAGPSYRVPVKPCRGKSIGIFFWSFFFIRCVYHLFLCVKGSKVYSIITNETFLEKTIFHLSKKDVFSRGVESSTESNNEGSPSLGRRRNRQPSGRSTRR